MTTDSRNVVGNWLGAFGTTIGAIGQTAELAEKYVVGQHLWIIGKGTQGTAAAIQAVAEEENHLAQLGNWLISGGASSVSVIGVKNLPDAYKKEWEKIFGKMDTGELKDEESLRNIQIITIANALQFIGAYIVSTQRENKKRKTGAVIQSYGALVEAIGALRHMVSEDETAQLLAVLGAWLQATGVSLHALGTTEVYLEERKEVRSNTGEDIA